MKKVFIVILIVLNIITVLLLLISYLSIYIPPDKWWFPSLFGLTFPIILLINIFFILCWLLLKPRYLFISLIAVLSGWGILSSYFQLNKKNIENGDIKVLSYNVMHFGGNGVDKQNETVSKITKFIDSQHADIICLQEVRLRRNNIFNLAKTVEELSSIKHYQYARSSTSYGSVTMTSFPILKMGEIRFENSRNISIYTDILIENDTVRVFNIHLQSYQIDPNYYSIIESQSLDGEKERKEFNEIREKYKTAIELRAQQVRVIRKYIDESPYHVILCGDFNDPPVSYSYHKIGKGLIDAFIRSGSGVGRTYVGKLPSLRIDYIFHSPGFTSYNFETLDFYSSDHLPVSCDLIKND